MTTSHEKRAEYTDFNEDKIIQEIAVSHLREAASLTPIYIMCNYADPETTTRRLRIVDFLPSGI